MALNQIKASIIDFENGQFSMKQEQSLNLADNNSITGLGQIISSRACRQMIERRFQRELEEPTAFGNEISAYEIGKEAILMILFQEGCEGIRFIHCINDEGEKSLVAMGIASNGKPLKPEMFNRERTLAGRSAIDPVLFEKIGRITLTQVIRDLDSDPQRDNLSNMEKAMHLTDKFMNLF